MVQQAGDSRTPAHGAVGIMEGKRLSKKESLIRVPQDFLALLRANGPLLKSPTVAAKQDAKRARRVDHMPTRFASASLFQRFSDWQSSIRDDIKNKKTVKVQG